MVQNGGRVEVPDSRKVIGLDVICGIQAAPGQDRVLDADRHDAAEPRPHNLIALLFQTAPVGVIGDVGEVVRVDLIGGAAGHFHQPPAVILRHALSVPILQTVHNSGAVFLT
ncbi:MAG: hypothetical protein IJT94_18800 [Oscillibacter sp.]|nr:hypothetical protein [Oscillibacter sp.]